jgi:hypothetical protein
MDTEVDLQELPGIHADLAAAEKTRRRHQIEQAVYFFEKLIRHFEELKNELNILQNICVCAAIDFGEVGLKLLGDPNVRLEFDIEGLVVIRCARLEAYTKNLRSVLRSENSFLVVSAVAMGHLTTSHELKRLSTEAHPVSDFQDEKFIYYKEYKVIPSARRRAA